MMEKKNITENRGSSILTDVKDNKRFNIMGSEVVDGYACKPKKLDPNKPIMHYKSHIFICEGERCKNASKDKSLADTLRAYVKDIGHIKSAQRIKISRSNCYGACRFRQVAVIFENTKSNGFIPNNNVFLKNVHKYDEIKWKKLFNTLVNNIDLENTDFELIQMKELEEEKE